jgi:hypothetical protein
MNKKTLISLSILGLLLASGCSGKSAKPDIYKKAYVKKKEVSVKYSGETRFESVKGSDTIIKIFHKLKGKKRWTAELIISALDKTNEEIKKRGYRYYQIVFHKPISNLDGFPINNKEDLASFINPATSVPRHTMGMFESRASLMDNQSDQNVVKLPFTIFGDTEFNFIVRMVKEPMVHEIVWDVEKEGNNK